MDNKKFTQFVVFKKATCASMKPNGKCEILKFGCNLKWTSL